MRKLFQADSNFFSDLSGDPNIAIRVQELIQDYSQVEAQRKQGIKENIRKFEGRALPGIIQSTYTLWKRMKADQSLCDFLKTTINSICESNDSARHFLMRHGIAKNPFKESREWLINVVCEMKNANKDNAVEHYLHKDKLDGIVLKTSPELTEFLPLWSIYDFDSAYELCHDSMISHLKRNTAVDLKEALVLLSMMTSQANDKITDAVYTFFTNIYWDSYFREYDVNFISILKQTPAKMTSDNLCYYINALEKILSESQHPKKRNNYVESFFVTTVRASLASGSINLSELDEYLRDKTYIVIYWFQAIWSDGNFNKFNNENYFTKSKFYSLSHNYAKELIKQYLLQEKWGKHMPIWLNNIMLNVKSEYPAAFTEAENDVENIRGRNTTIGNFGGKGAETGGSIQNI